MSDHIERACTQCGSLLHHEDDCPNHPNNLSVHHGTPNPASDTAREAAEHFLYSSDIRTAEENIDALTRLLDDSTAALRREVEGLKAERDKANAFSSKVERGEVRFAQQVDEQMQRIVALPLGKTIHEGISDAVARVLADRDTALAQLAEATKERDEARTRAEYFRAALSEIVVLERATELPWSAVFGEAIKLAKNALAAIAAAGGTEG